MIISAKSYARAGLIGNPSDGYYGKTISVIVKNFEAEVELWESPELEIVAGSEDVPRYPSLEALTFDVAVNGYYGGVRLIKATVARFARRYLAGRTNLPNFTIRYRTNIPRQVGLGGSSALITAATRALAQFYDVPLDKNLTPTFVLEVETKELELAAGLQDRVIQTWEGAVYMDFERSHLEAHGYGKYEALDTALLPPLFMAYRTDVAELSTVPHSNLRERFNAGDKVVTDGMVQCAALAVEAHALMVSGRGNEIGPLIDRNFDVRRSMMALDPVNLRMVEIARRYGAHSHFTGSGGAIVGIPPDGDACDKMMSELEKLNCCFLRPIF